MYKQSPLVLLLAVLLAGPSQLGAQTVFDGYPRYGSESLVNLELATSAYPQFPGRLNAPATLLFEPESGIILHESNKNLVIPPASLTKIMTIHVLRSIAEEKGMSLDSRIQYSPAAWAVNAPPQSSLMFLGPSQITTLRELLLGLAVSSGNDAAVAAAEIATGSVESFVEVMNAEARRLGMRDTHFVEPSGYSAENRTSAADLARFAAFYLDRWPDANRLFHSVKQFIYPDRHNIQPGHTDPYRGITQNNRNGLLWSFEGAEGIKTGFIDESGYNLVAVAERDGMKLVAVVLGVQAPNATLGSRLRDGDAEALLRFGFENFRKVQVNLAELPPVRIRKYEADLLGFPNLALTFVVPIAGTSVKTGVDIPVEIEAPLRAGSPVATLHFFTDREVLRADVLWNADIPELGGLAGMFDAVSMWFRDVFQGSPAGLVNRYWLAP